MTWSRVLVASILGLGNALAVAAHAGDGRTEINQARAAAGSINGDALADPPDFPVVLSQPGSYVLTGNLVVLAPGVSAIEVITGEVSLDLAGFAILGPTGCVKGLPGNPPACAPVHAGRGVNASGQTTTRIRNGRIRGMGVGVDAGDGAHVEAVLATSSSGDGIVAGPASLVHSSQSALNLGIGISLGSDCVATENDVASNGSDGIRAGAGSTLGKNRSRENLGRGIAAAADYGTVVENEVTSSGQIGIEVGVGYTVAGNAVSGSGVVATAAGIATGRDGVAVENTAVSNTGVGLQLALGTGYAGNVANLNNGGNLNPQILFGIQMGPNVCGGALCP